MPPVTRRDFLTASALGLAAVSFPCSTQFSTPTVFADRPQEKLRLGLVGCGGRGLFLTTFLSQIPNAEIVAVCDPDRGRLAAAKKNFPKAKDSVDMRAVFDDPNVDAVLIATCNHWHVLAAIWAMEAGKDVYLEKPLCLNFWEGTQVVAAAKKYGKICQIGTQMRADPEHHPEAREFLHEAKTLGAVRSIRVNRFAPRRGIGKRSTPLTPPKNVDYNLWLGPAPDVPLYRSNLQYDWHWMWNTGNGETGNWGAHLLDDCRNDVFLDRIRAPKRVLAGGARIGYDDAGETPNEMFVYFDTGEAPVVFCISNLPDKANPKSAGTCDEPAVGYSVRCEGGRYVKYWGRAVAYDEKGKKIREFKATSEHAGPGPHLRNFVDAVLAGDASRLYAPLEVGRDSATWYNGANTAYRLGEPYSKAAALDLVADSGDGAALLTEAIGDLERHLTAQGLDMNADTFKTSRFLEYDGVEGVKGEYADAAARLLKIDYRAGFVVPEIS